MMTASPSLPIASRLRGAAIASAKHLLASCLVAGACAALVFGLWYPFPYSELVGGRELFFLVVTVDVVCGPLLTFVVFNEHKPWRELARDIGVVVLLQLAALAYGLHIVAEARPVFLAFEGDRFRVVRISDIDSDKLAEAPAGMLPYSLRGPRLIGVRLAKPGDRDYAASVVAAIAGEPPAFRPGRWAAYDAQRAELLATLKPLALLRARHANAAASIDAAVRRSGATEADLGFLPLAALQHDDWVVIVSRADARPKAFLPLDGFQ